MVSRWTKFLKSPVILACSISSQTFQNTVGLDKSVARSLAHLTRVRLELLMGAQNCHLHWQREFSFKPLECGWVVYDSQGADISSPFPPSFKGQTKNNTKDHFLKTEDKIKIYTFKYTPHLWNISTWKENTSFLSSINRYWHGEFVSKNKTKEQF